MGHPGGAYRCGQGDQHVGCRVSIAITYVKRKALQDSQVAEIDEVGHRAALLCQKVYVLHEHFEVVVVAIQLICE